MMRITILTAFAVAIAVTAAVLSSERTEAHGAFINSLLWMSSVGRDVSGDLKYCTGTDTDVYHGLDDMFLDVMIGNSVATLCAVSTDHKDVRLRTWGFTGTYHATIAALSLVSNTGAPLFCNYVQLGMIDAESYGRGNAIYTHATGADDKLYIIYAGPSPGAVTDLSIGQTVDDPGVCGDMEHVHQGMMMTCPATNSSLSVSDKKFGWGLYDWVHGMQYTEGHAGC